MSTISTLHDAVINRVSTTLSGHLRLSNPYQLEQNPDRYLEQGYGVAFGGGINSDRQVACKLSMQREIVISITRRYLGQETDVTSKATLDKQLYEDQLLVIKDLYDNITEAPIKFVSDGGTEFIVSDKSNYLALRSTFQIEYFESI